MADFDFLGDKLFDPRNLDELKDKMAYWLEHSNDDIELEQRAVKEKYDWKRIAEGFYQLLRLNSATLEYISGCAGCGNRSLFTISRKN